MDSVFPAFNYVGWYQRGQINKPQTGGLGFAMTKHPRLDNLVWLAYSGGYYTDWILQSNPGNGRIKQGFLQNQGPLPAHPVFP